MNRRACLKYLASSAIAAGLGGTGYGFFEASWVRVEKPTFRLPNLPPALDGLTVAFLTDIHFGPYNDLDSIRSLVRTTNLLDPDVIVLGGDYAVRDRKYIAPCFDVLADLRAPHGVFGVLGTHDYRHGVEETRAAMRTAKVTELTNAGVWLKLGDGRLRLAGVDDLERGKPALGPALGDAAAKDACVLVSHNPTFAESIRDPRVGLVLSGHSHGGQVRLPVVGSPWVGSGQKYRAGFVQAPETKVYVSRGLGVSGLPVRFGCRPELTLLTLTV
jgi:hypothetical protein